MATTLSRALRKQITKDWNEEFPTMVVYKNMRLMNILGPLAVCLLLDGRPGSNRYTPILHVHNLAEGDDFISLTLTIQDGLKDITGRSHPVKYKDFADKLKQKIVVPVEGDVKLDDLIKALKNFCGNNNQYEGDYFACDLMVYLSLWSGKEEIVASVKEFIKLRVIDGTLQNDYYIKFLDEKSKDLARTSAEMHEIVERSIVELKLEKIPRRKLIVE